ncbi:hypothetical protein TSUD_83360 [Trifolium subterraneum]|uniref:Reverse transcriptase zinc-binding domain-containing protein n=1 Tax=Trifolium subterraneum TaxID=3900 RepID=A0A2Z6PBP0_TRISU|nr:hypothetical protein TSUD_83360 [Trifolium subterraneum]
MRTTNGAMQKLYLTVLTPSLFLLVVVMVLQSDSPLWKSIGKVWSDINKFEAWSIGDGLTVNCWKDIWIDTSTRLGEFVDTLPNNVTNWRVHDLVDNNNEWKLQALELLLPGNIIGKIKLLPPPCIEDGPDMRVWTGDQKGNFTISSAYRMICGFTNIEVEPMWQTIWKLRAPERVRCFAWQIAHGRLPTNKMISRWANSAPFNGHAHNMDTYA